MADNNPNKMFCTRVPKHGTPVRRHNCMVLNYCIRVCAMAQGAYIKIDVE